MEDQWMQILNFNNLAYAGFDCEDGSLLVLQLYAVLLAFYKTLKKFPDWFPAEEKKTPEFLLLKKIATIAQAYVPFMCIGELNSGSSGADGEIAYTPHAFVVCLPRATLAHGYQATGLVADEQSRSLAKIYDIQFSQAPADIRATQEAGTSVAQPIVFVPSLGIDATTYCDGAWLPEAIADTAAAQCFKEAYSPIDAVNGKSRIAATPSHVARVLKPKAPISAVIGHRIYRDLYCAMTPFASMYTSGLKGQKSQHPKAKLELFVFRTRDPTDGHWVPNCSISDFILRKDRVCMRSLFRVGHDEWKDHLQHWMTYFPMAGLPHAPEGGPLTCASVQERILRPLGLGIAATRGSE